MKTQQKARSFIAMFGIRPNQSLKNVKFLIPDFIMLLSVFSMLLFVLFEASDFREYTYGIFLISTLSMTFACFTIFAMKKENIFNMFDIADELNEKSK